MSLLFKPNLILNRLSTHPLDTKNKTLTQKNLIKFFQCLNTKNLSPKKYGNTVFFSDIYRLVYTICDIKSDFAAFKLQCLEFLDETKEWESVMKELDFLNKNPIIIETFTAFPESPIFTGLLLTILAAKFKKSLKIFQYHNGKSLITCEVGSRVPGHELLRIAIWTFADGFKFCVLEKYSTDEFDSSCLNEVALDDKQFEVNLTKAEVNSLKILTENIGFYPQLFVDYSDLLAQKEYFYRCKTELTNVFDNIATTLNANQEKDGPKNEVQIMGIENLGIEDLNPKLKANIFFGQKIFNLDNKVKYTENNFISAERPPGLFMNYTLKKNHEDKQGKKRQLIMGDMDSEGRAAEGEAHGGTQMQSKKPPVIVKKNEKIRFLGKLKFVDEKKNFGFMVKDIDNTDIFFHLTDMEGVGIPINKLQSAKDLRFSFSELEYIGRYAFSKKAVDIRLFKE